MFTMLMIQLFWFSIVLVGAVCAVALVNLLNKRDPNSAFSRYISSNHIGVFLFISFCAGSMIYILPTTLAYIFEWPVAIIYYFYLLTLLSSLAYVFVQRKRLARAGRKRFTALSKKQIIIGSVILTLLLIEYCLGVLTGGNINDDVPVHLARIQLILNHGFTLADPFSGYNGILDLRYSTNLLNALQTVPAYLLGVPAYKVWLYSNAFYNLVIIGGLFTLAKTFLPKNTPKEWAYFLILLVPFFGSSYFFDYAELPHSITLAWFSLMFVGLKLYLESKTWVLLLLSSLLIATTHALSAFTAAIFLIFLAILLVICRKIRLQQLIIFMISIFILIIPVIANMSGPSRSTEEISKETTGRGLHAREIEVTNFGPVKVPKVQLRAHDYYLGNSIIDIPTILVCCVLTGYVVLLKRIKQRRIKIVLSWLILLAGLEVFNILYAATAGYLYLIFNAKNVKTKILIISAVIFFALFAYNPIVLSVLVGHVPIWLIARSQDLNTFAYIAPILGVLVIYRIIVRYWKISQLENGYSAIVIMIFVSLFSFHKLPLHTNLMTMTDRRINNARYYKQLESLKPYDVYLKDKIIFSTNPYIVSGMSMVTRGEKMGIIFNYQSAQEQNAALREACNDDLRKNISYEDLKAAKINAVVVQTGKKAEPDTREMIQIAAAAPYLKLEKQIGDDRVYSVIDVDNDKLPPSKYCNIPYGQ